MTGKLGDLAAFFVKPQHPTAALLNIVVFHFHSHDGLRTKAPVN